MTAQAEHATYKDQVHPRDEDKYGSVSRIKLAESAGVKHQEEGNTRESATKWVKWVLTLKKTGQDVVEIEVQAKQSSAHHKKLSSSGVKVVVSY